MSLHLLDWSPIFVCRRSAVRINVAFRASSSPSNKVPYFNVWFTKHSLTHTLIPFKLFSCPFCAFSLLSFHHFNSSGIVTEKHCVQLNVHVWKQLRLQLKAFIVLFTGTVRPNHWWRGFVFPIQFSSRGKRFPYVSQLQYCFLTKNLSLFVAQKILIIATFVNLNRLKTQQGLLVDFCAFPQKFVDLLELCRDEEQRDHPK